MNTRAARNQKAYRDRNREKARMEHERLEDMWVEVLDAIEVEEISEGGYVEIKGRLSKDSPAFTTFQLLASELGTTNLELWQEMITRIARLAASP